MAVLVVLPSGGTYAELELEEGYQKKVGIQTLIYTMRTTTEVIS